MKFSIAGQDKGDLLIQVIAEKWWPHVQIWLYIDLYDTQNTGTLFFIHTFRGCHNPDRMVVGLQLPVQWMPFTTKVVS